MSMAKPAVFAYPASSRTSRLVRFFSVSHANCARTGLPGKSRLSTLAVTVSLIARAMRRASRRTIRVKPASTTPAAFPPRFAASFAPDWTRPMPIM